MNMTINSIKTILFNRIKVIASERNMSQRDISKTLNIQHGRVSNLIDERKDLFSIDDLVQYASQMGYDVEIKLTEKV